MKLRVVRRFGAFVRPPGWIFPPGVVQVGGVDPPPASDVVRSPQPARFT